MAKPSTAAYLRKMNGQRVRCLVTGIPTIEDIDNIRETLKATLMKEGIPVEQLQEDEGKFFIKDGTQFWLKPKLYRESYGELIVRSKDYIYIREGKTIENGLHGSKSGFLYHPEMIKVEKPLGTSPRDNGLISFELVESN